MVFTQQIDSFYKAKCKLFIVPYCNSKKLLLNYLSVKHVVNEKHLKVMGYYATSSCTVEHQQVFFYWTAVFYFTT